MSRRVAALKPQLNRIRAWAHEGSTDAWIAHQLETTAESIRAFRQEHGIERGGPAPLAPITPDSVVEAMLAEEAAALEAGPEPETPETESAAEEPAESAPARAPRRRAPRRTAADAAETPEVEGPEVAAPEADGESEQPAKSTRRRGTRGGAGRSAAAVATEAPAAESDSDDEPQAEAESEGESDASAGDEPVRSGNRKRGRRRGRGRGGSRGLEARLLKGSVLLLDPSVIADPAFQEHWQGAGPLRVEVSTDAIVLRRIVTTDAEPDSSEG